MFKERLVHKSYVGLVCGRVQGSGVMTHPVGPDAQSAQTHYEVCAVGEHYTALWLTPITGRKRQIREHLFREGFPIVGDTRYGGVAHKYMLLHAMSIEVFWRGCRFTWVARLPEYFYDFARAYGLCSRGDFMNLGF